ncbi:MAG: hypothetical protein MUP81_06380 [Dehalococcoidia bacterium]|nr:hypothetical protein [Dehalococcoidia bacterium]
MKEKKIKFNFCIICGKEYNAQKPHPACHCQICKVDFKIHPKCNRCGILIGPNHVEESIGKIEDGKIICASCKSYEMKFGKEIQ